MPIGNGGDRELAIRRLYVDHYGDVLRYLRARLTSREEAEDLTQEAYLRVYRQPGLERTSGRERSYLFRTAANLLRDRHRRRRVRRGRSLALDEVQEPAGEAMQGASLELRQTLALVKNTIRHMDPEVRAVFLLRRFQHLSHVEIAIRLEVSVRTVERRFHRAVRELQEALARWEAPDDEEERGS